MKSTRLTDPSRTRRLPVLRTAVAIAAVVAVAACAAPRTEDGAPMAAQEAAEHDPLEPVNRAVHGFNQAVDHVVLRPVSYGYRAAVPENLRTIVRNVLRHLSSPVILANDLLQGDLERAENTAMRLWINTTFGFGLADVAADAGFAYENTDFGQTLALGGVDNGPYLVLPLLGPSTARDAVGRAVDWAMDPLRLYVEHHDPAWKSTATTGRTVATVIDTREAMLDPIEEIERTSLDIYASYRSAYLQRRAAGIAMRSRAPASLDGSAFDFDE